MSDLVAMARAAQHDDRLSDGALYGKLADRIEVLGEQAAELRYEAGMYQSLYETAKARIEALEAALREVGSYGTYSGPNFTAMRNIARAAFTPEDK